MGKRFYLTVYLYRNYDKDLLALRGCDVSFGALVRLALYYYVRGSRLNIYVSGSYRYEFHSPDGKAFVQEPILITDPESIRFLKSTQMINNRERLAFVRTLLRGAIIRPVFGAYLKNDRMVALEDEWARSIDLNKYNDLVICRPLIDGSGTGKTGKPFIIRRSADLKPCIPDEWCEGEYPSQKVEGEHVSDGTDNNEEELSAGTSFEDPGSRRKKKKKKKKYGAQYREAVRTPADGTVLASAKKFSEDSEKASGILGEEDKKGTEDAFPVQDKVGYSAADGSLFDDGYGSGLYSGFLDF